MQRFRFRLEALLRLRLHAEEEAQKRLAREEGKAAALREALRAVEAERAELFRQAGLESRPATRLLMAEYGLYLEGRAVQGENQVEAQERQVEAARQAFLEARREVKVLEELEEKQRAEYRKVRLREEGKALDEAAARGAARRPLLPAVLFAASLLLGLAPETPAALIHAVDDFRGDVSPDPADTLNLDARFGDSLQLASLRRGRTLVHLDYLAPLLGGERFSTASPLVARSAPGRFAAAYLAFGSDHRKEASVDPNGISASIKMRRVRLDEDTILIETQETVLAANENPYSRLAWPYVYGGLDYHPSPAYLNFMADSQHYAAFWGAAKPGSPFRYASQRDAGSPPSNRGHYLHRHPSPGVDSPLVTNSLGFIAAAYQPGSRGTRTAVVVAQERGGGVKAAEVRWLGPTFQVERARTFTSPRIMEDFALAADSGAKVLLAWKERVGGSDQIFIRAFDSAFAYESASISLASGAVTTDSIGGKSYHYHSPIGVCALARGHFLVSYAENGRLCYRQVALTGALDVSAPRVIFRQDAASDFFWPQVTTGGRALVLAWFQRPRPSAAGRGYRFRFSRIPYRMVGAAPVLDTAAGEDAVLGGEEIRLDSVASHWRDYHHLRTASIAADDSGHILGAFETQYDARLAVWLNARIFPDTGVFLSRALPVGNPSVPEAFLPGRDSVEFLSLTADAKRAVRFSLSPAANTSQKGPFLPVSALPFKSALPFFRYRAVLQKSSGADSLFSPRLRGLAVTYNLKPRAVQIDSIRIGGGVFQPFDSARVYAIGARRDSLHFKLSALDLDSPDSLRFSAFRDGAPQGVFRASRTRPGAYAALYSLPPEPRASRVALSLISADPEGWQGRAAALALTFANTPPRDSVLLLRHQGGEAAGIFRPSAGPFDTLRPAPGALLTLNLGDTASLRLFAFDGNDDSLTWTRFRNGIPLGSSKVGAGRILTLPLLSDTAAPLVDTLVFRLADADTVVERRYLLRPNLPPVFDSVGLVALKVRHTGATDSAWLTSSLPGLSDSLAALFLPPPALLFPGFSRGPSLPVHPGLPLRLRLATRDRDGENFPMGGGASGGAPGGGSGGSGGSSGSGGAPGGAGGALGGPANGFPDTAAHLQVAWTVLEKPPGCAAGNLACHLPRGPFTGHGLETTFKREDRFLRLRLTDTLGAFTERLLALSFALLDSLPPAPSAPAPALPDPALAGLSGAFRGAGFAGLRNFLRDSLQFVIDARPAPKAALLELGNNGTAPLLLRGFGLGRLGPRFFSLTALAEDGSGNLRVTAPPFSIAPGGRALVLFSFFADSIAGDSVHHDTLTVFTGDVHAARLAFPLSAFFFDLPKMRLLARPTLNPGRWNLRPRGPFGPPPADASPALLSRFNDAPLPPFLPAASDLLLAFTEPVRTASLRSSLRLYSRLDSLKTGVLRPLEGREAGGFRFFHPRQGNTVDTAFADSLLFSPALLRPSDSLRVRPPPGQFAARDRIGIRLSNAVVDRLGKPLDLRLDSRPLAVGSLDTVFEARIDTTRFRVVKTVPAAGDRSWNARNPLEIHFSHPLSKTVLGLPQSDADPGAADPVALDTSLVGASNRSLRLTSAFRGERPHDLRFLRLGEGDSVLFLQTRPYIASRDTVTVTLRSRISDVFGRTLDGDGDGLPGFLYAWEGLASASAPEGEGAARSPGGAAAGEEAALPAAARDDFTFSFVAGDQAFYVFPNPFRFSDSRHRDKGSITFKNLNALAGYPERGKVELRIHDMMGESVRALVQALPLPTAASGSPLHSLDWDMRNGSGRKVATGVYLYTLLSGNKVLTRGKVAVVR